MVNGKQRVETMKLQGENLFLRPLGVEDAEELWKYRTRNKGFLKPFEPLRTDEHYRIDAVRDWLGQAGRDWLERKAFLFGMFQDGEEGLIGTASLTGVAYGAFQSANIGYSLDEALNGRGYMTEAVRLIQSFAFGEAELHRIQAAVMPHNTGSLRVLEKNGFRLIGLSARYLKINGSWEDHLLLAKTAEDGGPQH